MTFTVLDIFPVVGDCVVLLELLLVMIIFVVVKATPNRRDAWFFSAIISLVTMLILSVTDEVLALKGDVNNECSQAGLQDFYMCPQNNYQFCSFDGSGNLILYSYHISFVLFVVCYIMSRINSLFALNYKQNIFAVTALVILLIIYGTFLIYSVDISGVSQCGANFGFIVAQVVLSCFPLLLLTVLELTVCIQFIMQKEQKLDEPSLNASLLGDSDSEYLKFAAQYRIAGIGYYDDKLIFGKIDESLDVLFSQKNRKMMILLYVSIWIDSLILCVGRFLSTILIYQNNFSDSTINTLIVITNVTILTSLLVYPFIFSVSPLVQQPKYFPQFLTNQFAAKSFKQYMLPISGEALLIYQRLVQFKVLNYIIDKDNNQNEKNNYLLEQQRLVSQLIEDAETLGMSNLYAKYKSMNILPQNSYDDDFFIELSEAVKLLLNINFVLYQKTPQYKAVQRMISSYKQVSLIKQLINYGKHIGYKRTVGIQILGYQFN